LLTVKFLIVDDSAVARKAIRRVLEMQLGVQKIFEAENGEHAIEILHKEQVEFIISDWEMPGMNGEEFLYEVRNSRKWKDLPFIMATIHGDRDHVITAIQNGVSNYVVKPFSAKELEEKIRRTWSSSNRRESERYYSLPKHQAVMMADDRKYTCTILNISRMGMLVQLKYDPSLQLMKTYDISIIVEWSRPTARSVTVSPLEGMCTRLELDDSFHPSPENCCMGLWFGVNRMEGSVERSLNKLLDALRESSPDMIHDNTNIKWEY